LRKSSKAYVVKRKIKNTVKRKYPYFLGVLVVVFLFVFTLLKAFPTLKYNITPFFRVSKIEFKNVFYNNVSDLEEIAKHYKGRMYWDIDKNELEESLNKVPWVDFVKISSVPSNKITVIVQEKQPAVIYRDKLGKFWIVDETGKKIVPFTTEFAYRSFPVVTCSEKDLPFVVGKLMKLKDKYFDTFYSRLSQVVVKDIQDKWVCFVRGVSGKIYVEPFGFFQNVGAFLKTEKMIAYKFKNIDYIDLSIKKQIIVKEK